MTALSNKTLFMLWVAAVIAAAVALTVLFGGFAGAAELNYCKIYANRMSAMALQRLIGVPFIDPATGRFLYRKAYTSCLNSDEEPPIVLSEEQQPLITGMPSPPTRPEPVVGSALATDAADPPVDAPVAPKAKPKPVKAATAAGAGADQPLCTSHNMRTVYSGKHWVCKR